MRLSGLRGHNLVAVCCYFNPCHYAIRRQNYELFRTELLKSGIRLLTVELAFGADAFELEDSADVLRLRGGDIMWQKERLLQIGAEHLVDDGYDGFVFIDADTIFKDSDWPVIVAKQLEKYPVVQCFSEVEALYSDARLNVMSAVKQLEETGSLEGRVGHVWAMRSDVVYEAGLYQHCIIGGGDSAQFLAVLGQANDHDAWQGKLAPHDFIKHYGTGFLSHYQAWAARFRDISKGVYGYADLQIRALSHGSLLKRGYETRHQFVSGLSPEQDIKSQSGKPFEWSQSGVRFGQHVKNYFFDRDEDDKRHQQPTFQIHSQASDWPVTTDGEIIRALQAMLGQLGFSLDAPDGRIGPNTKRAIQQYQHKHCLPETGTPSEGLFEHMRTTLSQ